MKRITEITAPLLILICAHVFLSCSSAPVIPSDLSWDRSKHTYLRAMHGHRLKITAVNGINIDPTDEVKTKPGTGTVSVKYKVTAYKVAGWAGIEQDKNLEFEFLPGMSHYIQYIAYYDRAMDIWQYSHDYISHCKEKPVFTIDVNTDKDYKVKRVIDGSLKNIHDRFLNELLLQELRHEIISTMAVSLMFRSEKQGNGYKITVYTSGIDTDYAYTEGNNPIMGYYTFTQLPGKRVEITMQNYKAFHSRYEKFMVYVFTHFDPSFSQLIEAEY